MSELRKGPKLALTAFIAAGLFFGGKWAMANGYVPTPAIFKAKVIETDAQIANMQDSRVSSSNVATLPLPSSEPANIGGPELKLEVWAWNAHIGPLYAIGGFTTTRGSLAAKYKVNASVRRQDDTDQMTADLVTYAKERAGGNKNPKNGVNAVTLMGSQLGPWVESINTLLSEVGDGVIGVSINGRSDGEDAFMGPKSWKDNPKNAIGGTVSMVEKEGDADIVKKWAKDNSIRFNADPKTFDPDALNVHAAKDFVVAADDFNANACEDRPVVTNGMKSSKTHKTCIDAVSTWTPADVKAAKGRGGVVRIVSTHEYTGIMPNVLIVLRSWAKENPELLTNAIRAFGEAGDQVLSSDAALNRACEISARVYNEEKAAYWCKYYRGVVEPDAKGQTVQLGGSRAGNLADNIRWFGLKPGMENIACRTYTTFGKMQVELYPAVVKKFPSCDEFFDLSYLQNAIAASSSTSVAEADTRSYKENATGSRIAERSWNITFRTGSAEFTPQASQALKEILNDLVISDNTVVEVKGHTDNVGSASVNESLSERRAQAVKNFLEKNAPANFPRGRIKAAGFGDTQPVASNDTEAGRSQNRRVDIVQRRAQ